MCISGRRYQSVASFDGGSSGGTDDLPLDHSVFTLDDSGAPSWGGDRRNGSHQPGGGLPQQQRDQQRDQQQHRDGSETGASGSTPPGPVGALLSDTQSYR